jgi:hypothetical protein
MQEERNGRHGYDLYDEFKEIMKRPSLVLNAIDFGSLEM